MLDVLYSQALGYMDTVSWLSYLLVITLADPNEIIGPLN